MHPKRLSILGIPVNQLNTIEAVEAVIEDVERYRKKHPIGGFHPPEGFYSNYFGTLNVDYLSEIHGWSWNTVRHPELLGILRRSQIVTAGSLPLLLLSRFLGNSLKEKVGGKDFVSLLAEALGQENKSLFLLGGEEKTIKLVKKHLQKVNAGLKVVGALSPSVFTEGERICEAEERDSLIIEEIHAADPDVLLICLGHPKQEIWFERVRRKLRVPIAIGAGSSLNTLTGKGKGMSKSSRHPNWSWAYSLFNDPKRFIKRGLYNFFHFMFLSIPLITWHRLNQFVVSLSGRNMSRHVRKNLLFQSENKSIAVVRAPRVLDVRNKEVLEKSLDEALFHDTLLIDFQETRHIDLEGLGLLLNVWTRAEKEDKNIFGFGINWSLCTLLKLHRIWSLFSNDICSNATEVTSRLFHKGEKATLYEAFHQRDDTLTISFFGKLENKEDFDRYLQRLVPMLHLKECVVDLTYCALIENMGFYFLLKLKQHVESHDKTFKVVGAPKGIINQFRTAGLGDMVQE